MTTFNKLPLGLGREVVVSGMPYLYFGGTAYLGIPQHAGFIRYYLEGIKLFGLNNGTSRSNNIQLGIYDDAEAYAAQKYGAEAALITSSGYLAAQLTIKHFQDWPTVIYAPATHPALWLDKNPEVAGSFKDWSTNVINRINRSAQEHWVVISNALNNLFPEQYDFSFLTELHPDKFVLLIVDDSHGIGITGGGLGAYSGLPKLPNVEVVVLASMAKALGVDAGLVLGSALVIDELKQTNMFLGASPPAAAGLYAFMQSQNIYKTAFEKLQELVYRFTWKVMDSGLWSYSTGYPVFLSRTNALADQLMAHRILISSFPYPDKEGLPLDRVVLSSWHTEKDVDRLAELLLIGNNQ